MIKVEDTFNGVVLIAPIVIGAFLSGIIYLAEGAAIPFTIFQIALVISFILFGIRQLFLRNIKVQIYGLEVYYLLFFALIFFSIVYSPEREQALFLAFRMLILFMMTYLIYNVINDAGELKFIGYVIIVGALIVSLQSLIQFYFNPEIAAFNYANQGQKLMRGEGTETDPNIFASNLIPAVMILAAFFGRHENFLKRLMIFSILGIILAAVLLTYSRSSWVAIAVGLAVLMITQKRFSLLLYLFVAFAVAFTASETIQNLTFSLLDRFIDIFSGESDDSSKFRIILAQTALLIILDTYLLGIGYQGFSSAFQNYHPKQETAGVYEPHNEFYAVFSELGLVGFILFLAILWQIFKRVREAMRRSISDENLKCLCDGLFASFISYLIFFQFIGGMLLHSIFLITISLIFCAYKISMNDNGNSNHTVLS